MVLLLGRAWKAGPRPGDTKLAEVRDTVIVLGSQGLLSLRSKHAIVAHDIRLRERFQPRDLRRDAHDAQVVVEEQAIGTRGLQGTDGQAQSDPRGFVVEFDRAVAGEGDDLLLVWSLGHCGLAICCGESGT